MFRVLSISATDHELFNFLRIYREISCFVLWQFSGGKTFWKEGTYFR